LKSVHPEVQHKIDPRTGQMKPGRTGSKNQHDKIATKKMKKLELSESDEEIPTTNTKNTNKNINKQVLSSTKKRKLQQTEEEQQTIPKKTRATSKKDKQDPPTTKHTKSSGTEPTEKGSKQHKDQLKSKHKQQQKDKHKNKTKYEEQHTEEEYDDVHFIDHSSPEVLVDMDFRCVIVCLLYLLYAFC
jgi:hypothetical protein